MNTLHNLAWLSAVMIATAVAPVGAAPVRTASPYVDQGANSRIQFIETWRGAYFKTYYHVDLGYVQFLYCGDQKVSGSYATALCRPLQTHRVDYSTLDRYQQPLLNALTELRDTAAQEARDSYLGRLGRLLGGNQQDHDVSVLDRMMSDLKREGFKNWVLQKKDPETPLMFNSPKMADRLAAALERTLKLPLENPEVSPPPVPGAPPDTAPGSAGAAVASEDEGANGAR